MLKITGKLHDFEKNLGGKEGSAGPQGPPLDPRVSTHVCTFWCPTPLQIMEEYFSFVVVRNPWRRLLSAYRDLFAKNDTLTREIFHLPHGREIMQRYRKNASALACVAFCTLLELWKSVCLQGQIQDFGQGAAEF